MCNSPLKEFLSYSLTSKSSNLYRVQYALEELMHQNRRTTFTDILSFGPYNRSATANVLASAQKLGLINYDSSTKEYSPQFTLALATLSPDYKRFLLSVLSASLLGSDMTVTRLLFTLSVMQRPVEINDLSSLLGIPTCLILDAVGRINNQLRTQIVLLTSAEHQPTPKLHLAANTAWF